MVIIRMILMFLVSAALLAADPTPPDPAAMAKVIDISIDGQPDITTVSAWSRVTFTVKGYDLTDPAHHLTLRLFLDGRRIDGVPPTVEPTTTEKGQPWRVQFILAPGSGTPRIWGEVLPTNPWGRNDKSNDKNSVIPKGKVTLGLGTDKEFIWSPSDPSKSKNVKSYEFVAAWQMGWGIAVAILIIFAIVWIGAVSNGLRDRLPFAPDPGRTAYFSLARGQALWWTIVIFPSCVFIAITTGSLSVLTGEMLILLGLSAVTALGAHSTVVYQAIQQREEKLALLLDQKQAATDDALALLTDDKLTKSTGERKKIAEEARKDIAEELMTLAEERYKKSTDQHTSITEFIKKITNEEVRRNTRDEIKENASVNIALIAHKKKLAKDLLDQENVEVDGAGEEKEKKEREKKKKEITEQIALITTYIEAELAYRHLDKEVKAMKRNVTRPDSVGTAWCPSFLCGLRAFFDDVTSDETGLSIKRLQLVLWTGAVGIYIVVNVILHLSFPPIGETTLGLLGISGGAYLWGKTQEHPTQTDVAGKGGDVKSEAATPKP